MALEVESQGYLQVGLFT